MTRVALLALLLALAFAPAAGAHPLGNFSVNHLSTVSVAAERVDVRYVLDQAEIPTVREQSLSREEVVARKLGEIARGLVLTVDGRRAELRRVGAPALSFPAGAGGLRTTRLELVLRAVVRAPRRVVLRDDTFAGRVGFVGIVSARGDDPSGGLRRYPAGLDESSIARREASFAPEAGTASPAAAAPVASRAEEEHGFTGLFAHAAAGEGVLVLLLVAAFGWGALHALSPGHGKAMVAAYLIGTRGTARHAVALGAAVTVAHTAGVFALGVVTLALSQYVLAEDLYPWLGLASGLLVVGVGGSVLRARYRAARRHAHKHGHHHHHEHDLSWRGVLGMGTAAGLIPCPSALVVLLAAISQHELALGLLLIVAFSVGLAATLTALGIAVVSARRLIPRRVAGGRLATALPALSALLIVGVGLALVANAVPDLA